MIDSRFSREFCGTLRMLYPDVGVEAPFDRVLLEAKDAGERSTALMDLVVLEHPLMSESPPAFTNLLPNEEPWKSGEIQN